MSVIRNNKKGFTLIELVIVLAIAALIIVGVLLAVNGAQKSRRDSQRKSDLARIMANVESEESNAGGVPTAAMLTQAVSGINDPLTGNPYSTGKIVSPNPAGNVSAGILISIGDGKITGCDGTSVLTTRNVMLQMGSESVGTLCVDDH